MKNPQKITRMHLSADDHVDLFILGIVTVDADYKISLKINNKLSLSLKGSESLIIREADGRELIFSKFTDNRITSDTVFHLLSNRSGKSFLIKRLKNVDYILLINDPDKTFSIDRATALLREIDTVTAVFYFDYKTLKDRNLKYIVL